MNADTQQEWAQTLENLRSTSEKPSTVIAICGATGSGKSSLINALLDDRIVPTSGWQACTSVVIEISYHTSPTIDAKIEFLSREEWAQELTTTLSPYGRPRRAVHAGGKIFLEQFSIKSCYLSSLADELGKDVASKEASSGPSCLADGVVLVDLPGTSDANSARNSIAEKYIEKSELVWIVAPITRAVDDKVAKDLLGDKFKAQMMMDGRVRPDSNAITFIATKCDDISCNEIIEDLNLHDDNTFVEMKNRQETLPGLIRGAKCSSKEAKSKIRDLKNAKKSVQDEWTDNLKKLLQLTSQGNIWTEAADDSDSDSEMSDEGSMLDTVMTSPVEDCIKENKKRISELESSIQAEILNKSAAQTDIASYNNELKSIPQEIERFLFEETLRSCSGPSQSRFSSRYEDLNDALAERNDPLNFDPSLNNLKEYEKLDLPVFMSSSRDYMKLTGKIADGKPTFTDIEDTEIPAIRAWITSLTKSTQERNMNFLIVGARMLLESIISFCETSRTDIPESERISLRIKWASSFDSRTNGLASHLIAAFGPVIDRKIIGLKDSFRKGLEEQAHAGADMAAHKALSVHESLAKRNKVAIIRHYGSFREDDLNEHLTQPLANHIACTWANVFKEDFFGVLFESEVLNAAETVLKEMAKCTSSNLVQHRSKISLEKARIEIGHTVKALCRHMDKEQRKISREMTPYVRARLSATYESAMMERGKGCIERQKHYSMQTKLRSFISQEKEDIFKDAADALLKSLLRAADEIKSELISHFREISFKIELSMSLLWEPRMSTETQIQALNRKILEEITQRSLLKIDLSMLKSEESSSPSRMTVKVEERPERYMYFDHEPASETSPFLEINWILGSEEVNQQRGLGLLSKRKLD
ncbi:hypothetical protein BT96DRAFT_934341 [Gymnopus androsaceus JB14]|uniref:Dynamin N-terminal domain-containing protein n=1 Tax=Gymnopus androsaceus JB14 TaxID=1447944 RepID=A0A6A4I9S2_9AGAR|nr:hypothetical protein BT96DRAFT_934341 [Gymnopus androsaceus JB14]